MGQDFLLFEHFSKIVLKQKRYKSIVFIFGASKERVRINLCTKFALLQCIPSFMNFCSHKNYQTL